MEVKRDTWLKPTSTAPKTPNESQIRDTFQTPRYATEILIPFIPKKVKWIWECACGDLRMARVFMGAGYGVNPTDIRSAMKFNFVEEFRDENYIKDLQKDGAIITNPPFSIKDLFVERAFEYGVPFAMLINADYSGKTIDWIRRGCEKIIPTSRIAFITPNILKRIHIAECWKVIKKETEYKFTCEMYMKEHYQDWNGRMYLLNDYHNYSNIDDVPQELLYRYSSAQFHSMWLTFGFEIGRTETFVDLPIEQRKNNI